MINQDIRDSMGRFIKEVRKNKTYEEIYGEEKAQEIKLKQRRYNGEKSHMYGKHLSEETKIKLREKHMGIIPWNKGKKGLQKLSKEQIEKIRERMLKNNPFRGRHHSIETKMKVKATKDKLYSSGKYKTNSTKLKKLYRDGKLKVWNKGITKEIDKRLNYNRPTAFNSQRAIEIRKNLIIPTKDTSIEIKIQNYLKQLGIEFYTHQYIRIPHAYQCDILIPVQNGITKKTIIECFGNYWHKYPYGRGNDTARTQELLAQGYKVLVFWENEIKVMELENLNNELNKGGKK